MQHISSRIPKKILATNPTSNCRMHTHELYPIYSNFLISSVFSEEWMSQSLQSCQTFRGFKLQKALQQVYKKTCGMVYMLHYEIRMLFLSYLETSRRASISIIAASRYFCTPRTILIATKSFDFRSQHSKTWPNAPSPILLSIL